MLIEKGTYDGVTTAASIYEAPSGAVMCNMLVDVGGNILRGGICLVLKDGTLSERGFKDAAAILEMQGWDWGVWDNPPEFFAGHAVQAVVDTVEGDKGPFSSIKYLNPPGGGSRLDRGDAKALAAKYGAKTRAMMGGTPATAKPAPAAPAPAKAPPAPKPEVLKAATMEECWEVFVKCNSAKSELELYPLWAEAIKDACGKEQNDCVASDWAKVKKHIDNLPF